MTSPCADLVSIVVLTHNKLSVTARCLESLLGLTYPAWELIVIDNGSTDGTMDWLSSFRSRVLHVGVNVTLHANESNVGCSTSRNQGIELARGSWIAFLDNDIALRTRSWVERLKDAVESDPAAGMAGPKLVYPFDPFPIQCAGVGISRSGRVLFRGRGEANDAPLFNQAQEVQCLISACVLFRRSVLDTCGGFDEAFNPVEFEDFDLCYRARESGYRALYVPSVEMYHFESVTTAGTPALPNTYLIIKHGMLFKARWRHMFESENGPVDSETHWREINIPSIETIGELPTIDAG